MSAGRTNAKALLQKVNSQLRGERVPLKTKEEDELAIYLQSIAQKTQQVRTVGFEDYGDISISSGVQSVTPRGQRTSSPAGIIPAPSSNKFLKKKKAAQKDECNRERDSDDEKNDHRDKGILIAGKMKVNGSSSKPSNDRHVKASTLEKANTLTKKITSWSSRSQLRHRQTSEESESDESIRGSEVGKRPGSADTTIGRDGNKFLKNKELPNDNKTERKSPSPQLNHQRSSSVEAPRKSSKTKGEIVRTLGSVYLTSEEESLAEFIHALSASESLKKPPNLVAKKQQKWRKKSPSPSGRQSPSIHMSRSPSPFKNRSPSPYGRLSRSQSQDSDLMESMASEILEIKRHEDSASSADKFGMNLMDISNLLPADTSPIDQKKKKQSKKKSHGKPQSSSSHFAFKSEKKESIIGGSRKKKVKKSNASSSKDNFLESLGIQMVDDIFDNEIGQSPHRDTEISVSDESEIQTEKSDDHRKSHFQRKESTSEIVTELGRQSTGMHRSIEEVVSEKLDDKSSLSLVRTASYSADDSGTEMDENYSETFDSASETVDQHISGTRDETVKKNKSSSSKQKIRNRKVVIEEKSVDITAADKYGHTHHYNKTQTGISVSPAYGLQYVDPTPVSAHVINSDALEALTAYSPNMLALQDMMRTQLQLVKSFMDIQNRIYKSCMDGLSQDFQYTTLENTKEYIHKHRKPRMTFDEALKLVDLEGNNS